MVTVTVRVVATAGIVVVMRAGVARGAAKASAHMVEAVTAPVAMAACREAAAAVAVTVAVTRRTHTRGWLHRAGSPTDCS